MKIQALGGCCARSTQNYEHAVEAVKKLGLDTTVEHVKDTNQIMAMGVMATPALAIDGQIVSMGRLLSTDQIIDLIQRSSKKAEPQPKEESCCCGSCGCDGKK